MEKGAILKETEILREGKKLAKLLIREIEKAGN